MATPPRSAGRPPLVTYEDVARVCADLDARGLCTIENVHRQLGGVGSRTTVHKHYQAWRNQLRAAAAQPFNATFSEGLRLALAREIETQTSNARAELEGKVADLEEQLQSALGNLQEAEELASSLGQRLDAATAAAEDTARQHGEALAERQGRIDELEAQVQTLDDKLTREVQSAESARLEAAKAHNQLEIAKQDVTHFSSQHEQLLAEVTRLQGEAADADKRAAVAAANEQHHKDKLTAVQKELQGRLDAADKAHQALSEQLGAVRATAVAAEEAHAKRQSRIEQLEKQAQALDERLRQETAERSRLQSDLKTLADADKRAAVAVANEQHLQDKLTTAQQAMQVLQKRVDALEAAAETSGKSKG
jgi:chromosome segregation ATPase